MRGRLEEQLDHLNIREEAGGIVWVNPMSKCASCHSNEMHQRIIHTHVNVSLKAYSICMVKQYIIFVPGPASLDVLS
jgi:hypothetical protein